MREPLPAVVPKPPAVALEPLLAAAPAVGVVGLDARAEVTPTPNRGGFAPEPPPF